MKASFAVIFVCVAATIALALGSVPLNLEPGMVPLQFRSSANLDEMNEFNRF